MANYTRDYYRKMRKKHIRRKERIINEMNGYWHYKHLGELSKGKIHCSCELCTTKTNNKGHGKAINYKPSDLRKIEDMEYQLVENF